MNFHIFRCQNGTVSSAEIPNYYLSPEEIGAMLGADYRVFSFQTVEIDEYDSRDIAILLAGDPCGGLLRDFLVVGKYDPSIFGHLPDVTTCNWLTLLKFRINGDNLEYYLRGTWRRICDTQLQPYFSSSLFTEGGTSVYAHWRDVSMETQLTFGNKNITVSGIRDRKINISYWDGSCPEAIYCDFVKQMSIYQIVKQYEDDPEYA